MNVTVPPSNWWDNYGRKYIRITTVFLGIGDPNRTDASETFRRVLAAPLYQKSHCFIGHFAGDCPTFLKAHKRLLPVPYPLRCHGGGV